MRHVIKYILNANISTSKFAVFTPKIATLEQTLIQNIFSTTSYQTASDFPYVPLSLILCNDWLYKTAPAGAGEVATGYITYNTLALLFALSTVSRLCRFCSKEIVRQVY